VFCEHLQVQAEPGKILTFSFFGETLKVNWLYKTIQLKNSCARWQCPKMPN